MSGGQRYTEENRSTEMWFWRRMLMKLDSIKQIIPRKNERSRNNQVTNE